MIYFWVIVLLLIFLSGKKEKFSAKEPSRIDIFGRPSSVFTEKSGVHPIITKKAAVPRGYAELHNRNSELYP